MFNLRADNVKLWRKGLILVGVPLLFEVVSAVTLYRLEEQAVREARTQELHKQVIAEAQSLEKAFYDGFTATLSYELKRNDDGAEQAGEKAAEILEAIPERFADMRKLSGKDPARLTAINRLEEAGNKPLAMLLEMKSAIDSADHAMALMSTLRIKTEYKQLMDRFWGETQRFIEEENGLNKSSENLVVAYQHLLKNTLIGYLVASLLIGIALAFYFTRTIAGRLFIINDNARRLVRKTVLHPPLKGSDEIAELDHVFHSMADALTQATQQIEASELRIRSMVENMPVGLISIDVTGKVDSGNPAALEMFAFEEGELSGKCFAELFPAPSITGADKFLQQLLHQAGNTIKVDARRRNGSSFPAEISLQQVETQSGNRMIVNVQDVTERHELERLKQEFVAIVSHDLRTPLTSIQAALETLQTGAFGELQPRGKTLVENSGRSIERLIRLINDLLDMEKLEAGKFDIHPERVDLALKLQGATAAVSDLANKQEITISTNHHPALVNVDGDRIEQVLINLLSNAIKFSPKGSTVELSMTQFNEEIQVNVRDQGCGIPISHQQVIFERFKQVRIDDAKKKKGTGLGLAICKAIIEQHGGSIGVESEEGRGSTFWFRLPLVENKPATPPNHELRKTT